MDLTSHVATVSMIFLLMVILYPVSEAARRAYHYISRRSTLTRRLLNTAEELVCMPVRITKFIPHTKYSRYLMSAIFCLSLCGVRSTSVIGKL